MSPTPLRLVRIRQLAMRMAVKGALTADALARKADLSSRQAHWWIQLLETEGLITPLGTDPNQKFGRPRQIYGTKEA
jgi:predicted ArsR family transcriptional regulator